MLGGPMNHGELEERVRKLFGSVPCRLQVAALPWRLREGTVEIMLITSRDSGRWVLPKGWPEAREALCEASVITVRRAPPKYRCRARYRGA